MIMEIGSPFIVVTVPLSQDDGNDRGRDGGRRADLGSSDCRAMLRHVTPLGVESSDALRDISSFGR